MIKAGNAFCPLKIAKWAAITLISSVAVFGAACQVVGFLELIYLRT